MNRTPLYGIIIFESLESYRGQNRTYRNQPQTQRCLMGKKVWRLSVIKHNLVLLNDAID